MNAIQKGKTLKHGSFFHQISRQKALHVSSEAKETRAMQTTVINTFIINFTLNSVFHVQPTTIQKIGVSETFNCF